MAIAETNPRAVFPSIYLLPISDLLYSKHDKALGRSSQEDTAVARLRFRTRRRRRVRSRRHCERSEAISCHITLSRLRLLRRAAPRNDGANFDHRASRLAPIRNSSIARAHWRPSRIAQTTSDWPRRMSPAAKILGTEVR